MPDHMLVNVTVIEQREFDDGLFCFHGTIDAVIESLLVIKASIPDEYREAAIVDIETDGYYDSYYAVCKVSYFRLENEEEMSQRKAKERRASEAKDLEDRLRYEALKKKFG